MDRFIESIDKQIEFNQGKNIFLDKSGIFRFIKETINAISHVNEIGYTTEQILVDYATEKALKEFCRINQFYSFDSNSKDALRNIYSGLFTLIRAGKCSLEEIAKNHYQKLKNWIIEYNPFAEKIYSSADPEIRPVTCAEYSADLQMKILQLDIEHLAQPVLDIGCGTKGILVSYFGSIGISAYGIDRFKFSAPNLISANWLEYEYGVKKWGTIVSNLGFSNHFIHHNLREDGNYINYGKVYMKILFSLKIGGCFHYAPDLPFIEQYLDENQFELKKHNISENDFKTSVIKRLK